MPKHKTTSSTDSNTRTIRREGDYLVFVRKVYGDAESVSEYMTYHPELEKILMLDCLKPYREDGYLRSIVTVGGANTRFSIYDLALGCYTGRIHYDSYLGDIQKFLDYKRNSGYQIDHADSNQHNHTVNNLSFMTLMENTRKNSIVARFMLPNLLSVAYVNGKYRVCFGSWMNNSDRVVEMTTSIVRGFIGGQLNVQSAVGAGMAFLCEDAESLIACLDFLGENTIKGCDPVKTEKDRWRKDGECWFMDIQKSLAAQGKLAAMDESVFQLFTAQK